VSAPGPRGLPGGWPVRVEGRRVALDVPPGVDVDEAVRWQWARARRDGVARVDGDGTTHFTEAAAAALRRVDAALAEPLPFEGAAARWHALRAALAAGRG
jgi:hypothetical protein